MKHSVAFVFPRGHVYVSSDALDAWLLDLMCEVGVAHVPTTSFFTLGWGSSYKTWPPRVPESEFAHIFYLDAKDLEQRFGMVPRMEDPEPRPVDKATVKVKARARRNAAEASEALDTIEACFREMDMARADDAIVQLGDRLTRVKALLD